MQFHRVISFLGLAGVAVAAAASPLSAQKWQGTVGITVYQLGSDGVVEAAGDRDFPSILDLTLAAIAAVPGVEVEKTVARVRGSIVHMTMPDGEMAVNYETQEFTMYNARRNEHATWTGDELKEKITAMMGGQPGGPDISAMMQRAREAMGVREVSPEGPYPVTTSVECPGGKWWGGHAGEVTQSGNPMQPGWMLRMCISDRDREAWESLKAMTAAMKQFDFGQEQDAKEQMEQSIIEKRGLPLVTYELEKTSGMSPSLRFEATTLELQPGSVSADDVNAKKGTKVPLEQFMQGMMQGRM